MIILYKIRQSLLSFFSNFQVNKTANRIKTISGYQTRDEGAFLIREMMDKKKNSKKKKKKKLKKITKHSSKGTRKKSKKNENNSKNDLADGIIGKSKPKTSQRITSQRRKLKEKRSSKTGNKKDKNMSKTDRRISEKLKTRIKASEEHPNMSIRFENLQRNNALKLGNETDRVDTALIERGRTQPNFEIFAGKLQESGSYPLEQALMGYQKNLSEENKEDSIKVTKFENTERGRVKLQIEQNMLKIGQKMQMEKDKMKHSELDKMQTFIFELKDKNFKLERRFLFIICDLITRFF